MELVSAASYNMLLYDTNENNKYFAAIWLHALPNMCITDPKCWKKIENALLIGPHHIDNCRVQ